MKNSFCPAFLPLASGPGAIFLLTSCRRGEPLDGWVASLLVGCIAFLLLNGCVLFRCLHERLVLRKEKRRLMRLLVEQQKALSVYRHQAEWKQRGDVELLIEKKERLAACLLAQLEMIKQRKLASRRPLYFSEAEWEELIALIDVAYDDFTLRLQRAYPALTSDAVRFCCLLRIGFSLDEISRVLSVTKDAVYKRRSRLRKDLLPAGDARTLEEFLAGF